MAAFVVRGRAGNLLQNLSRSKFRKSLPHAASQDLINHHVGCTSACFTSMQRRNITFRFARRDGPAEIIIESSPGASDSKEAPLKDATAPTSAPAAAPASAPAAAPTNSEDQTLIPYRDHYVPITRLSIIRHLMTEKEFLKDNELKKFDKFAKALDSAIINKYHGLLEDLKSLFDPINPDKDTIKTRKWNRRERLDNEFWLLQKLAMVMERANFHEVSRSVIDRAMAEHVSSKEKVIVSVNTDNYDVLRLWALGKEVPQVRLTLFQTILNYVLRRSPPKPAEFYKRVVLAVRLKRDDKLLLKAFKEVPISDLSKLLPDGKISMSRRDKAVVTSLASIAGVSILAKVVTLLAHLHVDWMLIFTGVTGAATVGAWTSYKNRHLQYVNDLTRTLYFKNIANNRGLLTLLVDRAEDELFKEALLVYTFLLTNRAPSSRLKDDDEIGPDELGLIPSIQLERRIEAWVELKTGSKVRFESAEAVQLLQDLGLLSIDLNNCLHVLPLEAALRNLPQTLQTLIPRVHEQDLVEGYDHEITEEPEEEYKLEEKKRKKYGWF